MANGLYGIKHGWWEGEDSAVLGSHVFYVEIPESNYRDQGYAPSFDELPWRPELASYGVAADTW